MIRRLRLLAYLVCYVFSAGFAFGQTPISSATFSSTTAANDTTVNVTSAPDASGDVQDSESYDIFYGEANNEFITEYMINPGSGDVSYFNFVPPDTLIIQRTDDGRQLIIFYEVTDADYIDNSGTPNEIYINPDRIDNEEAIYQTGYSNVGYDNILTNSATNFANVERIDIIYNDGVLTSTPGNAVFPVVERNGNDAIKVAAIKSLDASGNPSDYFSTVISISGSDWGDLLEDHRSLVMRRTDLTSEPIPQTILGIQQLHGTAVSFTEFGIGANEIVYGYSIFAPDVTVTGSDLVDFTNATNYPRTGGSGLDLIAGVSTAVASDNNLRRATGPGGYKAALDTWLKANVLDSIGTSTSNGANVITWDDKWTGDNDAINALGTAPNFLDGSGSGLEDINFNATVDFVDATERGLEIPNSDDFNTAASYERKSINIAFRTGNNVTVKQQIYEQGGATRGLNIYIRNGLLYAGAWNENASDGPGDDWVFDAVSVSIEAETEYIVTLEHSGNTSKTGTLTLYLNGENIGSISGIGILYAHGGQIGLGDTNGGSRYDDGTTAAASFYGSIAELIYCNEPSAFSSTERRKVESYLALKYGITLDQSISQDYYSSDGTTIFDASNPASIGGFQEYNHDIAGIGRDDGSELEQRSSQSENSTSIVRVERNSAIGNDNNWLIWGNDDAALAETTSDVPSSIVNRLTRTWRASEIGEIGVTDISFDLTSIDDDSSLDLDSEDAAMFSLLVAPSNSSGDFSAAQVIQGGTISTIDGNTFITFSDVNIDNLEYFTLGTEPFICGPGGVTENLELWLKADTDVFSDAGSTVATNTSEVVQWNGQSINENIASGGATTPNFNSNKLNFNPSIDFINTNSEYMTIPDDGSAAGTGLNPNAQALFLVGSMGDGDNWSPFIIKTASYDWPNGWGLTRNAGSTGMFYHKDSYGDNSSGGDYANQTIIYDTTYIHTAFDENSGGNDYNYQLDFGIANVDAPGSGNETSTNIVFLGASPDGSGATNNTTPIGFLNGSISETVMYSNALTAAERQRVNSYLAIKYGITLASGTNYLAADAQTIFDTSEASSGYNNDIAGIGRDDASCLQQLQSKSKNDDQIVTMGLGEIAADNASNPNSFASDDAFLIWGNDDGATTSTAYTEGTVTERITRIWRAQENANTVVATDISFDLSGLGYSGSLSDYQLIISDNASLTSPTIIPAASLISDVITFSNIDLTDGQFFTLGTARTDCAPGGISTGVTLWLKADEGVKNGGALVTNGSVDEWENATTNASLSDIATGDQDPNKVEAGINYNPYIEFDGGDEDLVLDNVDGDVLFSDRDNTAFYAFNFVTGGAGVVIGGWESDGSGERLAYYEKAGSTLRNDFIGGANLVGTENVADRFIIATTLSNVSNRTLFINGAEDDQEAASSFTAAGNQGDFALGSRPGGSNYTASQSGELIIFNDDLSAIDIRKVESYLAIKYGITLSNSGGGEAGDYRDSDNNPLWDASDYISYHHDVAGIGRDDGSCFVQKQSTSSDGDDIVAIGLNSIASSNLLNTENFDSNGDFFLWGNDDGSTNIADTIGSGIPVEIAGRMERIWRADETGTVGNTEIQFDLTGTSFPNVSAEDYRLMIAGSGSGGSMASATLVSGGSFNGSVLSFPNIDLADGEYFTLGIAERCGPGGVNDSSLALWLQADVEAYSDAGTTLANNDDNVLQWGDQSGNTRNAAEENLGGGSPVEPILQTSEINYNPSILFSDPNTTNAAFLNTTNGNNVGGDMTLISVFNTAQNQGTNGDFVNTPALIGANSGGSDDYGLGVYQGQVIFNAEDNSGFNATSPLTYNDGETYIATASRVQAANGAVNLYLNSDNVVSSANSDNTDLTGPASFGIGNHATNDLQAQFQGEIAESIVFSKVLSADERTRVESYLALKYGLTRSIADGDVGTGFDSRDYRNAGGSAIWDYDGNTATYYNDIAGIGRDDNSCLVQLQSKSENDDAIVDISIDSFDENNEFFVWGNDNADMEATRNPERPSGINSRLNREWLSQETGTVGTVSLTFDLLEITGTPTGPNDLSDLRLMRSIDDDFSTGVTLTSPTSINSGDKTVTFDVDFGAGTGFYFTLGSIEHDALPIELFSFDAQQTANDVMVSWSTLSETNNAYFSIERSANGEIFESIGLVGGAGNSSQLLSYQFMDKEPLTGTLYYRLKQVDTDGTYSYSKIKRIEFVPDAVLSLDIYPNPIRKGESLNIKIGGLQDQGGQLTIFDSYGRAVEEIIIQPNARNLSIIMKNQTFGFYFMKLTNQHNKSVSKKFLIKD